MTNCAISFEKQLEAYQCDIRKPAWPDKFASIARKYCIAADVNEEPLRVLSLFSGAGGLDIGFRDAGFVIVEENELEEKFCKTLEVNSGVNGYFPDSKVSCADIRDYVPDCGKVDFIIGGPPCQTFSAAGRRANGVLGTTDSRGVLFKEYVRILDQLKPKGFLFENVYGIIGAQNGEPWRAIRKSFEEIGYTLSYRILDAADYGAPQHRERLIIVGLLDGEYLFPRPLFGVDSLENTPFYNAQTAIAGANGSKDEIPDHITGRYGYLIDEIPPGLNYSYYTEKMGHPRPVFAWRSKFSDFMYKADPEEPVRTIKAQGGQYTGPYHWEGRHFSLPEYKRLQTFPDSYHVVGGRGTVIHQLGNSVPPQLSRILALTIREQVFCRSIPVTFETVNKGCQLSFRKEKTKLTKRYREKARQAISSLNNLTCVHLPTQSYSVNLKHDFAFEKCSGLEEGRYRVEIVSGKKECSFCLTEQAGKDEKKTFVYSIDVSPVKGWALPFEKISGTASGSTRSVLTALWKTIEDAIASAGGPADLVQLNGYYQYLPKLIISLHPEIDDEFDGVLELVASGTCTRKLVTEDELSDYWGIDAIDVLGYAKALRTLGFEVRNNNTNPQIPLGEWLVPYEFPTLNPMSVQLRKQV